MGIANFNKSIFPFTILQSIDTCYRSKNGNFTDYIFDNVNVKVTVDESTNSITLNLTKERRG